MGLNYNESEGIRCAFETLQRDIHALASDKGWWDNPRPIPELLALMHSELSEALEAYREVPEGSEPGTLVYCWAGEDGKPEGFASELADVVIRALDAAEALGIDLGEVILAKHAYNATRAHRHGGKRC